MSTKTVSERTKSLLTVAICLALVVLAVIILATAAQGAAKFITTPIGFAPPKPAPVLTWRVTPVDMRVVKVLRAPRPAPAAVVAAPAALRSPTRLPDATSSSPMALGQQMAAKRGWVGGQWNALRQLWSEESGWSTSATNRSSGACGIPQRHPCNGLSSQPAAAQIAWGLDYIAGRYGTPSAALAAKHAKGWY